jgi:hypothetical protein
MARRSCDAAGIEGYIYIYRNRGMFFGFFE